MRFAKARNLLLATLLATGAILSMSQTGEAAWSGTGSLPPGTGRLWSIAVNPGNPNQVIAGTDNGVIVSNDAGDTWKTTGLRHVRVWAVGFDLRGNHTAFAGTQTNGAYTSADGATWTHSTAGLTNNDVRCLAFSLTGVAAGTDNGVFFWSTNSWGGIGLGGLSISSLAVAANSPSLVLAAGTDSGNVSSGSVYLNSGKNWSVVGTSAGLRQGAFTSSLSSGPPTQANQHRALLATLSAAPSSANSTSYPATYRSLDGGTTWEPSQGIPQLGGVQPIGLTDSTFSPLDPTLVYAGADAGGSTGGDLLRSTDGGLNFAEFVDGLPAGGRNVESIAVAPTNPPAVYVAIDSDKTGNRIYKTTDTSAPSPPQLLPESPGAPIPSAAAQPTLPVTHVTAPPGNSNKGPSGFGKFVSTFFGWPTPLSYELLAIVVIWYGTLLYRQRRYIEGPPD